MQRSFNDHNHHQDYNYNHHNNHNPRPPTPLPPTIDSVFSPVPFLSRTPSPQLKGRRSPSPTTRRAMPWHLTRRDLLLLLSVVVIFGLFLQLDFSLRFTDNHGGDSLLGFKLGLGRGGRGKPGYDDHPDDGDDLVNHGNGGMTVSEAKVKWGEEGAPRTEVLAHAPGWTVFDDIYLFNGTWYIVTDYPSSIPLRRMMISTGAEIWNDQASINRREPTEKELKIIFPSEAKRLWGNSASRVSDVSFLCNDPSQFLDHYYHFAAELLFGLWRTYSSLDPSIDAMGFTRLPAPSRMIFPYVNAGKWNDYSKMNSFLLRAIFPGLAFEYKNDWEDRTDTARVFKFDRVVLADRAAAFRGPAFSTTWRTSAEAATLGGSRYWWSPIRRNLLEFVGAAGTSQMNLADYGVAVDDADDYDDPAIAVADESTTTAAAPVKDEPQYGAEEVAAPGLHTADHRERRALIKRGPSIAPLAHLDGKKLYTSNAPVITYVSRQDWGRRMLRQEDHDVLVEELKRLEEKYGWEVHIVAMDKLSREEQIRLAARTTIMMGVHGNGLTHLIWMNNLNPRATVMEFFVEGGFAEDYEFTARALGMRHYGWWGEQSFTYPNLPGVAYPEGFQGNDIRLDGKAVAQLCERRLLVDRV